MNNIIRLSRLFGYHDTQGRVQSCSDNGGSTVQLYIQDIHVHVFIHRHTCTCIHTQTYMYMYTYTYTPYITANRGNIDPFIKARNYLYVHVVI